jgi:hypothetical protein
MIWIALVIAAVAVLVYYLFCYKERQPVQLPPPASFGAPTVIIHLMDSNEHSLQEQLVIPANKRKPTFKHNGRLYACSRQAGKIWIYREIK